MLIIELIPGESLLDEICRSLGKHEDIQYGLMPPEEYRLAVLRNIFEAEMAIYWDTEIWHSDLEPRNIRIRDDGSAAIIDFNRVSMFKYGGLAAHPKYSDGGDSALPMSPLERYWPFGGGSGIFTLSLSYWWARRVPQSWCENNDLAAEWCLAAWAGPTRPASTGPCL